MAANPKLKRAATSALRECMGLANDETLLVISDEGMRDIGLIMFESGRKIAYEAFYVEMSPRELDSEEPPSFIGNVMKMVDVIVAPTSKSITHTLAKRNATYAGVRIGTMPGITEDTLLRCMSAEYRNVVELTNKVENALQNIQEIHVTSEAGTDIKFNVARRRIFASTGVITTIGASGNIPSGEVYVAPHEDQANGTIVFDGSFANVGLIKDPVTVTITNGFAEKISGKTEARLLSRYLNKVGDEAKVIGEFGIGTNFLAELTGNILEDEKVLGTCHIAFGNNKGMGGKIDVPLHIDGVIKNPTIKIDGRKIMDKGDLLID